MYFPSDDRTQKQNRTTPSKNPAEIQGKLVLSEQASVYLTPDVQKWADNLIEYAVGSIDDATVSKLEAVTYCLHSTIARHLANYSDILSETDKEVIDLEHHVVQKTINNGTAPVDDPDKVLISTLVYRRYLKDSVSVLYWFKGKMWSVIQSIQGLANRKYSNRSTLYRTMTNDTSPQDELPEEDNIYDS